MRACLSLLRYIPARAIPPRSFFNPRRALVPASGAQEGLHKSGGVLLAVELASAAPDSIVHPGNAIEAHYWRSTMRCMTAPFFFPSL